MSVLKVHGNVASTATMRVLACLYEKEVQFQFIPVNLSNGEHKTTAFISLNPFGQVPAVEDEEMKLFESRAITTYLAHQHAGSGTQMIDFDHKKMAMLGVWMEVEAHQFSPAASNLVYELVVKPVLGMATNEAIVKESEEKLAKVLDVYEDRLLRFKFLTGDNFSLADLHHIPNVHYLMATSVKKLFQTRPHVMAWITDILARPAWSKVIQLQKDA